MNASRCILEQSKYDSVPLGQHFPFLCAFPFHYRASDHCNDLHSVKSTEYYLLFRRCDKIPWAKVTYRKSLFWLAVTEGESSTGDDQSRRLSYHIWITHREHRARTGSRMGFWLSKSILSDSLLPEDSILKVPGLLKHHHQLGTKCLKGEHQHHASRCSYQQYFLSWDRFLEMLKFLCMGIIKGLFF